MMCIERESGKCFSESPFDNDGNYVKFTVVGSASTAAFSGLFIAVVAVIALAF